MNFLFPVLEMKEGLLSLFQLVSLNTGQILYQSVHCTGKGLETHMGVSQVRCKRVTPTYILFKLTASGMNIISVFIKLLLVAIMSKDPIHLAELRGALPPSSFR